MTQIDPCGRSTDQVVVFHHIKVRLIRFARRFSRIFKRMIIMTKRTPPEIQELDKMSWVKSIENIK
jgi:hypothetical protein